MSELRIIPVVFGGKHFIITDHRMQYDYGQVLDFRDLELPDSFEARFSNSPVGESIGQIGTNNRIRIPKQFFESGEPIYCYITLHDEVTDGRTVYTTKVPIKPSTERTEEEPEPEEESIITQAITALNNAVDVTSQKALEASESADRAEHVAEGIEAYVERAEAAQQASESARDRAVQAETNSSASASIASEKASEAISSAATASQSAIDAEQESEGAKSFAESSAQSAEAARQFAINAGNKAYDASESAQEASGYASSANTDAQTASQKASEAAQSASTATQAKTDAITAKTASETAQGLAESARDGAVTAKNDAESARDEAQSIADGITGKVEQIDSNTERIESLEDDRYKAFVTDTASGAVASFPDGADDVPLKSCIVQVEPVQDLHGQDAPYPAGGGKNKLNSTLATVAVNGVTFTANGDGTYNTSGTASNNISNISLAESFALLPNTNYILSGAPSGGTANTYRLNLLINNSQAVLDYGTGATFTTPEEITSVRVYPIILAGANMDGKVYKPMIRLASESDTTFAPYENICPISGWTGCEVQRTGFNVWDEEWEIGDFSTTGEPIQSSRRLRSKNFVPIVPNATYFFAFADGVYSGTWFRVFFYDINKEFVSVTAPGKNEAVTIPNNVKYLKFSTSDTWGGVEYTGGISINYPATDHDYHPYTGQIYPITFPTSAGTVYGGYVDVINGELVIDKYYVSLGNSPSVTYHTGATPSIWIRYESGKGANARTSANAISNMYKVGGGVAPFIAYYGSEIDIFDDRFTDEATARSLLQDFICVYKLAEPIHYPLTPVEIKTLLGQNNLWADTGDTEVEYRADTKLYIEKLTQPEEYDMIADSTINSGQFFMVGNSLYRALANIASGATITVGTNAERVSLSDALNLVNA